MWNYLGVTKQLREAARNSGFRDQTVTESHVAVIVTFCLGDRYEKCPHLWWLLGPDGDREASLTQLPEAVAQTLAPLARKTKPRIQVFQGLRLNSSLACYTNI